MPKISCSISCPTLVYNLHYHNVNKNSPCRSSFYLVTGRGCSQSNPFPVITTKVDRRRNYYAYVPRQRQQRRQREHSLRKRCGKLFKKIVVPFICIFVPFFFLKYLLMIVNDFYFKFYYGTA